MATAVQTVVTCGVIIVGTIATAAISMAALRPALTDQPRLINQLDIHPPPTEPTSAAEYAAERIAQ